MRILIAAAIAIALGACAAKANDPGLDARKAWDECAALESAKQAKTDKPVELAADAAMAACQDKAEAFMSAAQLSPNNLSLEEAADATRQLRDKIREGKVSLIRQLRGQ